MCNADPDEFLIDTTRQNGAPVRQTRKGAEKKSGVLVPSGEGNQQSGKAGVTRAPVRAISLGMPDTSEFTPVPYTP